MTDEPKKKPLDIREDDRNYRIHDQKNLELIGRSLDEYGAARSIVSDASGKVIGGNGTLRAAKQRGIPLREIHTNGEELVVVVRDDILPGDPKRKELAVMDNSTSDNSIFNADLLQSDFSLRELEFIGVDPLQFQTPEINEESDDSNPENAKDNPKKKIVCPKCGHIFEE